MNTFLALNRDNIISGVVSSAIVAVAAALISYLSTLPPSARPSLGGSERGRLSYWLVASETEETKAHSCC